MPSRARLSIQIPSPPELKKSHLRLQRAATSCPALPHRAPPATPRRRAPDSAAVRHQHLRIRPLLDFPVGCTSQRRRPCQVPPPGSTSPPPEWVLLEFPPSDPCSARQVHQKTSLSIFEMMVVAAREELVNMKKFLIN